MTFTVALWIIAEFIYFSDRNNPINRWFAICYLLVSPGTFMEFMMDNLVSLLVASFTGIGIETCVAINNFVTAFLFLFSPFCLITLSMAFAGIHRSSRKVFHAVQLVTASIACLCMFMPFSEKAWLEKCE